MHFEPTLTLGTLLTIGVTIVSVGLFSVKLFGRLAKMDYKLRIMWNAFKKDHGIEDADDDDG